MPKRNCESYKALIGFIKQELEKREEWKKSIARANENGNKVTAGAHFTIFSDNETRENFVATLLEDIERVNTFLNQVAGRHHGRHQELVSLLVEQFELEVEVAREPKYAGGLLRQQNYRLRLSEIEQRIGEIINAEEPAEEM